MHGKQVHKTTSLKKLRYRAMTKNDTFILTIPPGIYHLPPGPYERACAVADYLKRIKGGGK